MRYALGLEEMEDRIAPTVVAAGAQITFTDANGDTIRIEYLGPDNSSIDVTNPSGGDIANGDNIGAITFANATSTSSLYVTVESGTANDIVIADGIFAPGNQDVGLIALGFSDGSTTHGNVTLLSGAAIDIGGFLGTLAMNGDLDCDQGGQFIVAGSDIGLIALRNLTLDPSLNGGTALIAAGGEGGSGNIGFIVVEDVFASTAATTPIGFGDIGTGVDIPDDAGTGHEAVVSLFLSGPATEGGFMAIPVVGGGFVVSSVAVVSGDTALTIETTGVGADVGIVHFAFSTPGVAVFGADDSDLLWVNCDGSIGLVANRTPGGDIGLVTAAGNVDFIETARSGILGSIHGGFGNALPTVSKLLVFTDGTDVMGDIGTIRTGGVWDTIIAANFIDTMDLRGGALAYTGVYPANGVGVIEASSIQVTDVITESGIASIFVGSAGMRDTVISAHGGIGLVSSQGAIYLTTISTTDFVGGVRVGAAIGSISADSLDATVVESFGTISSVVIRGDMTNTTLTTRFEDTPGYAGGRIESLRVDTMSDASIVETNDTIASVKIGAGGINTGSSIISHANIDKAVVSGDLVRGRIFAGGTLTSLKVTGDVVDGSLIDTGGISALTIVGSLSDSGVFCEGDAGKMSIGDGIQGLASHVLITGNVSSIVVNHGVHASASSTAGTVAPPAQGWIIDDAFTIDSIGSTGSVKITGSVDSASFIFGSVGTISITKSLSASTIDSDSSIGSLKVGGSMTTTDVSSVTNMGPVTVKGAISDSNIQAGAYNEDGTPVNGDVGRVTAAAIVDSSITATRNIAQITAKGIIGETLISATALDNFGSGPNVIGGGIISGVKASGLRHSVVESNGAMGLAKLGALGVDFDSEITTYQGDFAGLSTSGFISGVITVGGNLTGKVTSAGLDAVFAGGAWFFTDANGIATEGVMTVAGTVPARAVIS